MDIQNIEIFNTTQKLIYVTLAIFGLIYILRKREVTLLRLIIVMGFSYGIIFSVSEQLLKIYKLSLFLLIFYEVIRNFDMKTYSYNIILGLFSICFLVSFFISDSVLFSSIMYFTDFFKFFLLGLYLLIIDDLNKEDVDLVFELIVLQIIFSVVKLVIIGFNESVVGTIAYYAGSIATMFPILAIIFIYKYYGKSFSNKQMLYWAIGLLLISVASNKRAIWFFYPAILIFLFYNTGKLKMTFNRIILILLMPPILIYFGLRINPSLNPEAKVWGSFNPKYAMDYIIEYNFDVEAYERTGLIHGRLWGNVHTLKKLNKFENVHYWFGYGTDIFRGQWKNTIFESLGYHHHSITAAVEIFIGLGIIALILFIIFNIKIINHLKETLPQLYLPMLLFFIFDFIFYNGSFFSNDASIILFMFITCGSQNITDKNEENLIDDTVVA